MNITFTGDLCVSGLFAENMNNNKELFAEEIKNHLKSSDYTVTNLEGPTTNTPFFHSTNTLLKSPTNTIESLVKQKINIFNLANNHILDFGVDGLQNTISEIKKNNVPYFGAGFSISEKIRPCIITKNNISVALIGITETTPNYIKNAQVFSAKDFKLLKEVIKETYKKVNHIILNFHGGEEYTLYPSPVKRSLLKKIAKIKGVSMVIAHHSHTFQGIEKINSKLIFYSLGNFVFDIPNHKIYDHTDYGALLKLNIDLKDINYTIIPFSINKGFISTYDQESFKKHIIKISNFSNYKNKWRSEAFRVLFRKNNSKIIEEEKKDTLQNKSIIKLLFSKKFYSKSWLILNDNILRSLYISALIHKIRLKIQK